jgi:predicted permease
VFEALQGFITVSVPIVLGYLLARGGALSADTGKQLNLLAVNVLIPVLLFQVMAESKPEVLFSKLALVSLLAALAMFLVYTLVAGLVWRRQVATVTVGALAAGYTNANNIGLPIALHMLGNPALVAPVVLFQTSLFAPVGLAIMAAATAPTQRGTKPIWRVALRALASPIVVGSLSGLAVSVLDWELPTVLMEPLALVGGGGIPVMLIAFGVSLRGRTVLAAGSQRRDVLLASALKLVGMPLASWILADFIFGLDPASVYAATTLAALPTAQNVYNYALRYEANPLLARDTITLTTLGAAPLVFLLAALFH